MKHDVAAPGVKSMLIDGEWVTGASGSLIDVYNPATGQVIAQVPDGGREDVARAVAAARRAFDTGVWEALGPSGRAKCLWRIGDLIEQNIEELAALESLNNGMTEASARSFALARTAECFRYYAGWVTKIHGKTSEFLGVSEPILGYTLREPVGVAGMIVPWNSPLMITSWKLAAALAAGCTCVLKPAEETPLTALRLGELIIEAGVPAGVVNIVTGYGHTAGAALSEHPQVDKITFTGSTEIGKVILKAAAGNLKKVTLELGGKSPVVVFPDADIGKAIAGAARAIFNNSGQVCTAGSRLYVHESVFNQVIDGVTKRAAAIKVGPGNDPSSEMGPLISEKQRSRVVGYVKSGPEEGAEIVAGGNVLDRPGFFMQPTVITTTNEDIKVVREEIFGPVLVAQPFRELEEITQLANDSPFGLAASIWTQDIKMAHRLARRIQAGSVGINVHQMTNISMPFGGYKQSGWGRESGWEGIEAYLETKSVLVAL
ncbi:MAG TPA: aldehyde dehydrogenase family protein [Devosiaceae bacterium]|jgi:phenylacetaldehyde dehydrogenase